MNKARRSQVEERAYSAATTMLSNLKKRIEPTPEKVKALPVSTETTKAETTKAETTKAETPDTTRNTPPVVQMCRETTGLLSLVSDHVRMIRDLCEKNGGVCPNLLNSFATKTFADFAKVKSTLEQKA